MALKVNCPEIKLGKMNPCGELPQFNLIDKITQEHIAKSVKERDDNLRQATIKRLAEFGYEFEDKSLFEAFCKERITQVSKDGMSHICLDYDQKKEKGTILVSYTTDFNIELNGNQVTISYSQTK